MLLYPPAIPTGFDSARCWPEVSASDVCIVVCDDESDIRDMVSDYLRGKGYEVLSADGGVALREIMATRDVDGVVLDLRMPGEDGLSLARHLHEHYSVAIIMLTGSSETVDRVVGLEIGADDYIVKPVDLGELAARIKAVLRRIARRERPVERGEPKARHFDFGSSRFDLDTSKLLDASGVEIAITTMEARLLSAFAKHHGKALSRDQLLELAHGREGEPFDRSIDIRISRLRKKIEPDPSNPAIIRTLRGVGYVVL